MGMYTEMVLGVEIKNIPEVVAVLNNLNECKDIDDFNIEHKFFDTPRGDMVLRGTSCSFKGKTDCNIEKALFNDRYSLTVRSNIKNYDDEYELFLDWLCPYIDAYDDEMLGYIRYEDNELPWLIYKDASGMKYIHPTLEDKPIIKRYPDINFESNK